MQETHQGEANFAVASEDQARADFYALLARLYAAAPDAVLLSSIAACDELSADPASEGGRALADAWRKLIAASTAMDPAAARISQQVSVASGPSVFADVPGRRPLRGDGEHDDTKCEYR